MGYLRLRFICWCDSENEARLCDYECTYCLGEDEVLYKIAASSTNSIYTVYSKGDDDQCIWLPFVSLVNLCTEQLKEKRSLNANCLKKLLMKLQLEL